MGVIFLSEYCLRAFSTFFFGSYCGSRTYYEGSFFLSFEGVSSAEVFFRDVFQLMITGGFSMTMGAPGHILGWYKNSRYMYTGQLLGITLRSVSRSVNSPNTKSKYNSFICMFESVQPAYLYYCANPG